MSKIVTVNDADATPSETGEVWLATGDRVGLRLWRDEPPNADKPLSSHAYEVVGYVLAGRATLEIDGDSVTLEPGDSWCVPAGASHTYRIEETFSAVEAVAPPKRAASR